MENKKQGYKVRKYQGPVKRYCQMLNLKNDAALIAEYRKRHSEGKVWPETHWQLFVKSVFWKWKFISWGLICL